MVTSELVLSLKEARARTTRDAWLYVSSQLEDLKETVPSSETVRQVISSKLPAEVGWSISKAIGRCPVDSNQLAAAFMTVDALFDGNAPQNQVIWTGPSHGHFPVRRLDQYLYDLIAGAKTSILLVTFAAHKVSRLCEHLKSAVNRGVTLTLIVESEEESEGQLTQDALNALSDILSESVKIYHWPASRRERNQKGRLGKLHVKCAVVDEVAVIGSANLTDDAFNRNMELAVCLSDPLSVKTIKAHFASLVLENILQVLSRV
jgi:phosphatidylserine/phosphatidylglycerophosphate/cardiolipin synthase-like enzyme